MLVSSFRSLPFRGVITRSFSRKSADVPWLSEAPAEMRLRFPPKDAKIFDLESGEGLDRKIAVYNARHGDGLARTPVMCLYSGKNNRSLLTLRAEELQAVVELIPKLKTTFRKFSRI